MSIDDTCFIYLTSDSLYDTVYNLAQSMFLKVTFFHIFFWQHPKKIVSLCFWGAGHQFTKYYLVAKHNNLLQFVNITVEIRKRVM